MSVVDVCCVVVCCDVVVDSVDVISVLEMGSDVERVVVELVPFSHVKMSGRHTHRLCAVHAACSQNMRQFGSVPAGIHEVIAGLSGLTNHSQLAASVQTLISYRSLQRGVPPFG